MGEVYSCLMDDGVCGEEWEEIECVKVKDKIFQNLQRDLRE